MLTIICAIGSNVNFIRLIEINRGSLLGSLPRRRDVLLVRHAILVRVT